MSEAEQSSQTREKPSMPDKARLKQIAEYHGIRVIAYLAAFAAMDTWVVTTSLGIAQVLSVITALTVGHFLAGVFHEWGHFTGARLAQSRSPITTKPDGVFFSDSIWRRTPQNNFSP